MGCSVVGAVVLVLVVVVVVVRVVVAVVGDPRDYLSSCGEFDQGCLGIVQGSSMAPLVILLASLQRPPVLC